MAINADSANWWRVRGDRIVDALGKPVTMRGLCLGGWMNMENFVTGFPGNEAGQRRAVAEALGAGKANFFFERFLDYFLTEEDLAYMAGLGLNVVRVALNYRHFESDARPFEYLDSGFERLDRLVGWSLRQGLHVILDLHAAPGYQSPGWHCDNPGRQAHFWGQKVFEDRTVALWQAIARRYSHEPFIAGYNLLNEPVARPDELAWLHSFYRRATEAIREVDPDHILFLDGNWYAQRCEDLEAPFDDNTAYSYHFYPEPVLETGQYPATLNGVVYGQEWLREMLLARAAFMERHGVPAWAGEFGCIFTGDSYHDEPRLRAVADMLDIMRKAGHHWTLWHYKDIGSMGLVTLDPHSEWMERTRPVRDVKSNLRCDYWIERHPSEIGHGLAALIDTIRTATSTLPGKWEQLSEDLYSSVCQETVSQLLLPAFAEQFRDMTENEIDSMMQSFAFRNCIVRDELANVLIRAEAERERVGRTANQAPVGGTK